MPSDVEAERFSHVSGESMPELLRRVQRERFDPATHEHRRQRFFVEQLRKVNATTVDEWRRND